MPGGADIGGGIGGAIGNIAVLAGAGGPGGVKSRKKLVDLWNKLELSNFDYTRLSFPELKVVSQLMPQVYDAIVPPEVKTITEDPQARQAQATALGQAGDIAREGNPLADRIATRGIQNDVSSQLNRNTNAALRQIALRGGQAPGTEAQYRLAAGQTAGNTLADMGAQAMGQSLNRRSQAIGQQADIGQQLRAGDYARNTYNASAINNFNQQMANIRNEAAQYGAGARGRASAYNTETAQNLATQSAVGRVNLAQQEKAGYNSLLGANYQQAIQKLQGQAQAYGGLADAQDRERARREEQIISSGRGIGSTAGGIGGLL